jgi:LuxR family maltose regulon positive regulatory protein
MNAQGDDRGGAEPGDDEPAPRSAAAPELTAAPLIVTKLMVPAAPRGVICRTRLHQLLDAGARSRLILVVAPAGYGKTVLAATWLPAAAGRRAGWVSLDRGEDEPSRFWAYVLAAIEAADAGFQLPGGLAAQPGTGQVGETLAPLVNALAGLGGDLVLVLDDYHLITDPRIHAGVAFLIDQAPPRLHLVILARCDPPFPLARWAASGELTQARTRDLAFTAGEMTLFLDRQQVALPADLRPALFTRLGGWAAALRLVTLWVAGRDDPAAALAEFTASDATIADYLTGEVLSQLPARLRRFLLCTSILPRLTGPLCDAVTGASDGAQALAELDHRGMFTEALTPGRDWFRYHKLFAELLRLELQRAHPQITQSLHRRASGWFAAHGFTADAIDHGLAACDWAGVQTLMLSETLAIGSRYPPAVIEGWLATLPPRVQQASPFFLTLDGWVHAYGGRFADARQVLDQAQALATAPGQQPGLAELGALGYSIRAGIARLECDLPAGRAAAQAVDRELRQAGDSATPLARMARAAAAGSLAATMFWHGHIDQAGQLLRDTEAETAATQLTRMRVSVISVTALLLATAGRLRQADTLAAETLEQAGPGGAALFQATPALLATAVISLHRGEHAQARQQLATIRERAVRHHDRAPMLAAAALQARLSALAGNLDAALAILDEARTTWPGWQPPAALQAMIAQEEARICLLGGDLNAGRAVYASLQALSGDAPAVTLAQQATGARILLAEGHGSAASAQFRTVAGTALRHSQLPAAVETLTEAAIASLSAGQLTHALTCLEQALTLAHDETITGPFIRHAASVRPMLLAMDHGPGQHLALGFRQRLLTTMGVPPRHPSLDPGRTAAADSLSDRELTVLRLLHGNLTNPEIAAALTISRNTLKTHLKNIYRKLGVTSRQQAITRARQLNLQ